MNIYNLEIHKQCGLYSLPEDGSIKIMDRKEETEVLFLEEKLTYSKCSSCWRKGQVENK